jgi:uncharacterized protein (DUF983 family)
LLRGLRKRCPRCASPDGFDGYFQLRIRCPRCGLPFQKEEGGFLGAMTLNYLIAVLLWLVMLALWVTLTVPDIPVAPILVASIAVLAVVPIWFYPRSKMIWATVEYLVARSQPGYRPPTARDPRSEGLE